MSNSAKAEQVIVYVVDDDSSIGAAIEAVLQASGYEARCFTNALSFLDQYQPARPGCLLLDLRLPGIDGLELQNLLKGHHSDIPIVFISGAADVPSSVEAMKMGAVDFLVKPVEADRLLDVVQKALEIDRHRREKQYRSQRVEQRLEQLTRREKEVLGELIQGKANKVIAEQLGISPRTVEVHRAHIFDKMNASSVTQLVQAMSLLEEPG